MDALSIPVNCNAITVILPGPGAEPRTTEISGQARRGERQYVDVVNRC